jgi:alanine racemase
MKKTILVLLTLLACAAAYYAYTMYNKQHTDVATTEASEILTAEAIFTAFDTDDSAATALYADKVIQLEGMLLTKDLSNTKEPQIVLQGNGDNGFIRCGFKVEELAKVTSLKDSSNIKIKGMCKGFNGSDELDLLGDKDVVLSNCIIID